MTKFPVDAQKAKVIRALERLGFQIVREREHIAMARENDDGTRTPLTMPNHSTIKSFHFKNNLHPSRYKPRRISRRISEIGC